MSPRAMDLAPLPNTVCRLSVQVDGEKPKLTVACFLPSAEFRGPGVHHNFDDSDSGYDLEAESRSKAFGIGSNNKGRIIFLGDGTEVLTDGDDTEMFDNSEEDKDLASQVSKTGSSEDDGPPPRAPSPPPRGTRKEEEKPKETETATKDTPAETKTDVAADGSK